MIVLGIESSCDETSVAVVRDGTVLSNVVSSQTALHAEYGGVVPELATREHLRNFLPIARQALEEAALPGKAIDLVAATQGPGLPSALMVGFFAAQGLAFALNRPLVGIHHHEAHLYSPWTTGKPPIMDLAQFEPCVSLIVSGGHTLLVYLPAPFQARLIGETVDDAAGECFDKTAKLLGLPYPGGPQIDQWAEKGNPQAFEFPRPMAAEKNFSFSGLKTSVRYFVQKNPALLQTRQGMADLCASIQAAIVEVLVQKTIRAVRSEGVRCVTASGGVTLNRQLRRDLESAATMEGFSCRLADRSLCADNAAMVALLAEQKIKARSPPTSLDSEIVLNWTW